MKTTILTLLALLGVTTASADDLSLYLEPTAGETTSYAVNTLQKMTFENGNVVLTKKDGTAITAVISMLRRMYFDETATAINTLLDATPATYTVYNMNGITVGQGKATTVADIDMTTLKQGIYIVNIKNNNFKIVK